MLEVLKGIADIILKGEHLDPAAYNINNSDKALVQ